MRMGTNIKIAVAASAAAAAVIGGAMATAADQPVPVVPPHQHFVITASGDTVPVGPNACANGPSLQFDNFHFNVHRGRPFDNGIITFAACPVG